ncbi:MAG: cytochrome P450/oxidoreductase [Acetobacteraceae bacterium]|nr:cytochrome P450/oxidoreductase [Acetobacteraceae bacterium]
MANGAETVTCPMASRSRRAAQFDAFDEPYQIDPAEALRWSREREPVFYSDALGYWVVSRYAEVKAVFRDTANFSPSIVLDKVTPNSDAANAILARHDYAMNRTLVNEDEPAHMKRRRALMLPFAPEELAKHEPMVRRLTRQYVDRFIDRGQVDLVDAMLWEIPLTVALHFLGVPEDDVATLRKYSIAHTVNTWGRPTPDQQCAVAEAVGNFWQYAGGVLERMRADPSGSGWMEYAIRQQKELPEVITDSYLHSMMMAGIVAAHETTAHATANALRLLLQDRDAWDAICADPSLIPNAVEECLRLSGSIVAWRRLVLQDTTVGGVAIPKGAKLLIVMTSANHDERQFENPDALDIYRDNTTAHLSFGYGSHQCMGKNLARMEMRIFLEELTKRLPHMELVPGQVFSFVPNLSFRGPEHLLVRWDPACNPERDDPGLLARHSSFAIGAPPRHGLARQIRVAETVAEAGDVTRLVLQDLHGRALPRWSAGAHVDLEIGPYLRKYSLCGDPDDVSRLEVAVLLSEGGRGGSAFIHQTVTPGAVARLRGPKNHFRLDETADQFILIAGGIGITPIIAMADRLRRIGKDYTVHYAGRARSRMAFLARLARDHAGRVHLHVGAEGGKLDLAAAIGSAPAGAQIYGCGPDRMLAELGQLMADQPERLHVEHFASAAGLTGHDRDTPFEVELADSQLSLSVPSDQTLLQILQASGIDVPCDCEEGLCGSCEVPVLSGSIEHRDKVLSAAERAGGGRMMACCSRGRGKLVLAL